MHADDAGGTKVPHAEAFLYSATVYIYIYMYTHCLSLSLRHTERKMTDEVRVFEVAMEKKVSPSKYMINTKKKMMTRPFPPKRGEVKRRILTLLYKHLKRSSQTAIHPFLGHF